MRYQKFAVGEPFRYRNQEALRGAENFVLEWDRSGYMLIVALPDMTESEIRVIRRNPVQVSAIIDGSFVLPVWSFSRSDLLGETPFDPTAYRDKIPESLVEMPTANLVAVIGVDSGSMITRAIRVANLPTAWQQRVVTAWNPAWSDPGYSSRYSAWLNLITALPLSEVKQRTERLGFLGENIKE